MSTHGHDRFGAIQPTVPFEPLTPPPGIKGDGPCCFVFAQSNGYTHLPDCPRVARPDTVNHPAHYGGDTVYETIKVIEAWDLNFNLGNTVKYISRAGKKGQTLEDLKKARWYLDREIIKRENR